MNHEDTSAFILKINRIVLIKGLYCVVMISDIQASYLAGGAGQSHEHESINGGFLE